MPQGDKSSYTAKQKRKAQLFFAGEATSQNESASVGGAIDSGRRAAIEVLRSEDS